MCHTHLLFVKPFLTYNFRDLIKKATFSALLNTVYLNLKTRKFKLKCQTTRIYYIIMVEIFSLRFNI